MFAASTPAARSAPAVVVPQTRWQRVKKRARAMALDTVATLWWVYVVLQLFVVDIRGLIAGRDTASVGFFVIHRVVPLAAICLVLAVFFWGWKGLRRLHVWMSRRTGPWCYSPMTKTRRLKQTG